jgi:hypothetical protein
VLNAFGPLVIRLRYGLLRNKANGPLKLLSVTVLALLRALVKELKKLLL